MRIARTVGFLVPFFSLNVCVTGLDISHLSPPESSTILGLAARCFMEFLRRLPERSHQFRYCWIFGFLPLSQ